MKAEPHVIREIERLYEEFNNELGDSTLAKGYLKNFHTYVPHFVRWTKDDYDVRGVKPQPSHLGQ